MTYSFTDKESMLITSALAQYRSRLAKTVDSGVSGKTDREKLAVLNKLVASMNY